MTKLYSDSEPTCVANALLEACGNAPTVHAWHGDLDAPAAGDITWMSYLAMGAPTMEDWRTGELFLTVPATSSGDYTGSTCETSNRRSLLRDFPDTFTILSGDYGYEALLLPFHASIPEHLFNTLVMLADEYPLFDESDHSELEQEMIDEQWAEWGRMEFRNSLQDFASTDDDIDATYWRAVQWGESYAPLVDGGDVVFPGLDELAAKVAA